MKALIAACAILVPLASCADPETNRIIFEGTDGGLIGALVALTPEAIAERKRKAELRAAYYAKACEPFGAPESPAHQGCMLRMAEAEERQARAARRRSVTCHRFMNTVTCE